MGRYFVLCLFIFVVISCTSSESAIRSAEAQTQAALPTITKAPTETKVPTPTDTPTPIYTQTPTSTPSNTPTITPSATPTDTPTPTPTPDILKILQEAGIVFPEESTSNLEREYGEFNFRISKGLMDGIGKVYAHLPEDVLERMYLHAMGRYMFAARRIDPERFHGFIELAEEIREIELAGDRNHPLRYTDWPIFRELAEEILNDGPVPLNFKPSLSRESWDSWFEIEGEIRYVNNLNINFISKDEMDKAIQELNNEGVVYYTQGPILNQEGEVIFAYMTAVMASGNDIVVISYNEHPIEQEVVYPGANPLKYQGLPLSKLGPGFENIWYYKALIPMYNEALSLTQTNLLHADDLEFLRGEDWNEIGLTRFSPDEIGCGVVRGFVGEKARICDEKVNKTFEP